MKKCFLLFLLFIVPALVGGAASAATFTGTILSAEGSNPFGVSQDQTFLWTATWSGSPSDGWVSAITLSIPIGSTVFSGSQDVDASMGYPLLFFTSSELNGLDFLAADILIGDTLYAFTTNTPLPTESGFNPDWSTFSIFSQSALYDSDAFFAGEMELHEVITGELFFEPVPEPSTLILFGAGLIGALGVVRKRK